MGTNTLLYPDTFPNVGVGLSEVEQDILTLKDDSADTARKQLYSRTIAGLMAVQNQRNTPGFGASLNLMPFDRVGKNPTKSQVLGTTGFFVGGQDFLVLNPKTRPLRCTTITKIGLLGDSIRLAGTRLTAERQWPGVVGNANSFFTAGGWGDNPARTSQSIDKTIIPTESTRRVGAVINRGVFGLTGCGGQFNGYYFGGRGAGWRDADNDISKEIHRMRFSTHILTSLGALFTHNRFFGMTTAGSRYAAYLFGGIGYNRSIGAAGSYIQADTIEKFTYSGEVLTSLGVGIAGRTHNNSAKFGNASHIYIVNSINSGWTVTPLNQNIHRFGINGESLTLIGATSATATVAAGGTGSSANGYWGGGFELPWQLPIQISRRVEKLIGMSGIESTKTLGKQLPIPQSEQPGISNYAAGYAS